MLVTISTERSCSAERARVEDHLVAMRLLGPLPLGRQNISISFPTAVPDVVLLRDNGSGQLLRRWDHLITIESGSEPVGPGRVTGIEPA